MPQTIQIETPREFDFAHCLTFLNRSPNEILHRSDATSVEKALHFGRRTILFEVRAHSKNELSASILNLKPTATETKRVVQYIDEWFDLKTDLKPFYKMARQDDLLKGLMKKYHGYRIMGHPDLFESLIWAVLGQQINLSFAYTLKRRVVEKFGTTLEFKNKKYFIFPTPESLAGILPEQLYPLQLSKQKASYVVGIAQAFVEGRINKEKLGKLAFEEAKEALMMIKGIGNWTANYALMKTFRYPNAFPLEDAGLHNAIKNQLGLRSKPDLKKVRRIFKKYEGWEAYATIYLWKSL